MKLSIFVLLHISLYLKWNVFGYLHIILIKLFNTLRYWWKRNTWTIKSILMKSKRNLDVLYKQYLSTIMDSISPNNVVKLWSASKPPKDFSIILKFIFTIQNKRDKWRFLNVHLFKMFIALWNLETTRYLSTLSFLLK